MPVTVHFGNRATMNRPRLVAALLAAAIVLPPLAGCAPGGAPPVPDPMPETRPLPPVSAEPLRWRPGHWNWTGSGYAWTPGAYVPMTGTGTHWMPGHWTQSGGGRVWNPPGWVN